MAKLTKFEALQLAAALSVGCVEKLSTHGKAAQLFDLAQAIREEEARRDALTGGRHHETTELPPPVSV